MLPSRPSSAAALVFGACGALLFALSLACFAYVYLVRFGDPAPRGPAWVLAAFDVVLFSLFALHHSLLVRPRIKRAIAAAVTPAVERSLYVWTASLLFILVCALWQPVPGTLYELTGPAAWAGFFVQLIGVIVTARGSARLDVLDLAGLRGFLQPRPTPAAHVPLQTTGLYGFVRHPLYFGWILFVFGAPHMTMTRLVFATISTLYLAVAIPFEERSLIEVFGPDYRAYQNAVRWRMLPGVY